MKSRCWRFRKPLLGRTCSWGRTSGELLLSSVMRLLNTGEVWPSLELTEHVSVRNVCVSS